MKGKAVGAALIVALLAAAVWAESAVVQRNRVDILKGKGSLYLPPLATARKGDALEILQHDGRWLRVRYQGVEGYVLEASLNGAADAGATSGASGAGNGADAAAAAKGWDATEWAKNKGDRTDGLDAMRATRARVASDPAKVEKFRADMSASASGGSH